MSGREEVQTKTKIEDVSFAELMALEPHGPDTYTALAPEYPWGRLFGGQVLAQALRANLHTVEPEFEPHSLHAYFIRGGTHSEPVRFEVERLRDGRSFCARSVVARQSSGAILHLSASFQRHEDAPDVSPVPMPESAPPESASDEGWGNLIERRMVRRESGHVQMWVRMIHTPEITDPGLAACALAFLSDTVMSEPPRSLHPRQPRRSQRHETFVGASLDHAMHFHRPSSATAWILCDSQAQSLVASRGLTVGQMFSADGVHVATCSQEVLLRERTR